MSALAAFGLVAGVATLLGLVLALYYGQKQGGRVKRLAYQATVSPYPVASSSSLEEYNLMLMYEPRRGVRREIESAYVQYLRFANFGQEPIRREDIAPANPLRIEVHGADVLDVSIEASRREVCRVSHGPIEATAEATSIAIEFDFLDHLDGALVRLLTTSRPERVELAGDIIGMPEGVKSALDMVGRRSLWGTAGAVLAILFELASLVLTVFVYRWVLGEWGNVWLVALPLVALLVPALVSAFVSDKFWPKPGPEFPSELLPPGYRHLPMPVRRAFLEEDELGAFVVIPPSTPAPASPPENRTPAS